MTGTLFFNLLRISLALSAPAAALLLLSPAWNRTYAALWKTRLWCLLAALLLLGPWIRLPEGTAGIEIPLPARQMLYTQSESGRTQMQLLSGGTGAAEEQNPPAQTEGNSGQQAAAAVPARQRSIDILTLAEIIWGVGAAIFLLRLCIGEYLFTRRVGRWARPAKNERLLAVYRELCRQRGKGRCPELLILPDIGSPLMTGLIRHKLLLPSEEYTESEAACILAHELTHWKSGDLWRKTLFCLANAVHWFNPAVWLLRREAGYDLERACDEHVLKNADAAGRRAYGEALLSAARKGRRPALSTYFSGGAKVLQERLSNILSKGKRRGAAPAVLLALLTVCAVFLAACTPKEGTQPTAAVSEGYTLAATLSLEDAEAYIPETGDFPGETDESDINEVIVSRKLEDGTEVLFYWSQSGAKYCAYRASGSSTLTRFTQEDNEYSEGYAIETYTGLFGHDGFIIECPRGAAYQAYDYYYFDEDGQLRLLAQCANYVIDEDINGDGERELLWFYHGGRECYCYFEKDGVLYQAYVSAMVDQTMTAWKDIYALPDRFADGTLPIEYNENSDDSGALPRDGLLRFTSDTVEVYAREDGKEAEDADWASAELTVIDGVPYIRHSVEESWTQLGPAIAAPREWSAQPDLAGRGEATTLIGDPEITIRLVSAKDGWLTATYGRGVAAADTYIYRTHDGGKTWTETGQLTEAHWWPCAMAFTDNKRAVIAVGIFCDAPIFCTRDGGETWSLAKLPFSEGIWEAQSIGSDGEKLTMTVTDKSGSGGTQILTSGDGGATWELTDPAEG
ncbi:M56 family metallopeptidase [Papillibacter cinnamivorans]|uniref:Signal transducer regulating beta-lactamase production, contains metallopeptidase domain n=1 Tax=Papillibacter cinnamivorans DSM 12816 TaxID=1122930 RepID=A0A1W1YN49_9FIRM|nr:M56 family metallopeptidase [Papillibacter cinnamivorans]SMC37589.1 Signal transducer regulating beta-lactamase production, contains metallopeptidase domain [Papillibacter cinnamivorans DSM 12816]